MRRLLAAALVLVALPARATGFTDVGDDLRPRDKTEVELHGAFRVRGELLNNLDLDRGTTPSGELLYPVPGADPKAQSLYGGDLRLRTDLAFYSLGGNVAVKVRVDVLDDVAMGGAAVGAPSASSTQRSPPGDVSASSAPTARCAPPSACSRPAAWARTSGSGCSPTAATAPTATAATPRTASRSSPRSPATSGPPPTT
ncbi:MAG: hypothetical protein IPJ34_00035 [Myxococcales bacterium]|nr:hypothetical protein [Myxococcales bacterium]